MIQVRPEKASLRSRSSQLLLSVGGAFLGKVVAACGGFGQRCLLIDGIDGKKHIFEQVLMQGRIKRDCK